METEVEGHLQQGGDEWSRRVGLAIAARVRHYRQAHGLRGDDLAERCAALGYSMPKSAISKLETGMRRTTTLPEVLVLAAALGVPPIALILPVGDTVDTEVLPERHLPIDLARRWFDGTEGVAIHVPHYRDQGATEGMPTSDPRALDVIDLARKQDRLIEGIDCWTVHLDAATRARLARQEASAVLALRVQEAQEAAERAVTRYVADPHSGDAHMAKEEAQRELTSLLDDAEEERRIIEAVRALRDVTARLRALGKVPALLPPSLAWLRDDQEATRA